MARAGGSGPSRPPATRHRRSSARSRPRPGPGGASALRIETRARARALQALYAWDIRRAAVRGPVDLERVAEAVWDDLAVPPRERAVAARLVAAVAARSTAIDGSLANVTANWRLERLGAIERSVLRLGAAELSAAETPSRVVIQEAVRLAERYGSVVSAKFVNGVLDGLARSTGRL